MKELMAKRERARADLKDLEAGDKGADVEDRF